MDDYEVPAILSSVLKILNVPRTEYSRDFAEFISSSSESVEQQSYRTGLVFLVCLFASIWFIWTVFLLFFKCHGKSVGCAAGRPFEITQNVNNLQGDEGVSVRSHQDNASLLLTEDVESMNNYSFHNNESIGDLDDHIKVDTLTGGSPISAQNSDNDYKRKKQPTYQPTARTNDDSVTPESVKNRRAQRTRISFVIFCLVTLACVPLMIVLSLKPMVNAENLSHDYVALSQNILEEAEIALDKIITSSKNATITIRNMPLQVERICPSISPAELMTVLALNIDLMVEIFADNYVNMAKQVSQNIEHIRAGLQYFNNAVELLENGYDVAAPFFWVVPTLLLLVSSVALTAVFGVYCAWIKQSTRQFQRALVYGILPSLMLLSLICWAMAILSAVSTAVGSDACLGGSDSRAPSQTISKFILADDFGRSNPAAYRYISAFTTGCNNDPTDSTEEIQDQVQDILTKVRGALSQVDRVGQNNIDFYCNGGISLDNFLTGARKLEALISESEIALAVAVKALECERIYTIYDEVVNDMICTDVISAAAWSFLLFLILGISTMAMITLRASWVQIIDDDKIYDEHEVAENMIVDEHEEYLSYISKYKQEWEEYQGLDGVIADPILATDSTGSLEQSSSSSESGVSSDVDAGDDICQDYESDIESSVAEAFDPYNCSADANSLVTSASMDNISFLSLSINSTMTQQQSPRDYVDPLLIPTISCKQSEYDDDQFYDSVMLPDSEQLRPEFQECGRRSKIDTIYSTTK